MNHSRTIRRLHRLSGLALALPLAIWMATGLLFHVKHRYGEAYEPLAVPMDGAAIARAVLAPAEVVHRGLLDVPITLGVHPSGAPAYFGRREGRPAAIHAETGAPIPPATEKESRRWAEEAVAASAHRDRYGAQEEARPGTHPSARTGGDDPALVLRYSGGKRVTVDLVTGEIAQTGDLNDWIDLTYRLHYLQWTPWRPVNVALVLLAAPLVLWLAVSGLRIALRP